MMEKIDWDGVLVALAVVAIFLVPFIPVLGYTVQGLDYRYEVMLKEYLEHAQR